MQNRFNRRSGYRYTLMSIVLIILMVYMFKIFTGGSEADYPQTVYYREHKYEYTQTVTESSLKFLRSYGVSYEGNNLLLKRSDSNNEIPNNVYIFTGWRKYREYELVK